jgi:hypothetical protein
MKQLQVDNGLETISSLANAYGKEQKNKGGPEPVESHKHSCLRHSQPLRASNL